MKVSVRVEDRAFEVEIEDLYNRPIVAIVEGERFEIWPEDTLPHPPDNGTKVTQRTSSPASTGSRPTAGDSNTNIIHAPIPGVIIEIQVKEGDQVEVGQTVCVLEAMKMKNAIRAPRAGEIAKVMVKEGEHVKHHDLLFEYVA